MTPKLNGFEIIGCVTELRELASGDSKTTAKKSQILVTCTGQSTSLLKSTKIHFPEGFNSQSKETNDTISSTRSPDLIILLIGITENAAVFSPEVIPSSWYLGV